MLTKKHLYRWSFPLLLIVTVISGPVLSGVLSNENGLVNVAICPGEDKLAQKACDSLLSEKSAIKYTAVKSKKEAQKLVESGRCDVAWMVRDDFSKRIETIVREDRIIPLIDVYQRENSIALELSRGKLYGKTFSYLTYEMYREYVLTEIAENGNISEERIRETYDNTAHEGAVIQIKNEDSNETLEILGENYLLSPIRGFLSILITLCGLAAGLYFVGEKRRGLYSLIREDRHYAPAFGSCLGAILLSGLASLLSLSLSDIFTNTPLEILIMLLFCVSSALFCTFLCTVIRNVPLFGALIVPIIIIILIMCPIFFNANFLLWIKYLLPNYYYLLSVYHPVYIIYTAFYCIVWGIAIKIVSLLMSRRKRA